MPLLALLLSLAYADAPIDVDDDGPAPEQATVQARGSEVQRIELELRRLAQKGHWSGVERQYHELERFGAVPAPEMLLAAQAALQLGDTWTGYIRLVLVERADPELGAAADLDRIRREFGRLTVRRVDSSAISLRAAVTPFRPDLRHAIEHATRELKKSGGFDGMLPVGSYTLGSHELKIEPVMEPVVIQRGAQKGP